jgi:selenocysteine-specific elongation factor
LGALLGVEAKPLREAMNLLLGRRRIVRVDKDADHAVDADALAQVRQDIVCLLAEHHRARPTEAGLGRAELLDRAAKGADPKVLHRALQDLLNDGQVVLEGATARLAAHAVTADHDLQEVVERIGALVRDAALAAPTYRDLLDKIGKPESVDQALSMLTRDGRVVRVGETLYYDREVLARAEQMLVDYLTRHGEIDAQGMKTLLGVSRKWTIPLAEHFDMARVTLRVGDKRVLRRRE